MHLTGRAARVGGVMVVALIVAAGAAVALSSPAEPPASPASAAGSVPPSTAQTDSAAGALATGTAAPTSPSVIPSATGTSAATTPPPAAASAPVVTAPVGSGPVPCPGCWRPALRTSWNWVIGKVPRAPFRDVDLYIIDGFDSSAADVAALHAAGIKVVCYLSAGSYEVWRPDAGQFPAAVLGRNLDGWSGERWLDIREVRTSGSALARIMSSRLDMCVDKGFDGVEFDNVDGYTNSSGFPLTGADQLAYNRFLANAAHARGLSAALKNDVDQLADLVGYFDFALNEQCNQYRECGGYRVFLQAGKAVFNAEYGSSTSFCAADNELNINGVLYSLQLDDSAYRACR